MNKSNNLAIEVIDTYRNDFTRNKDQAKFISILKENREYAILLNIRHNIIETQFFIEDKTKNKNKKLYRLDVDWFGASYEILDVLFDKYKNDKSILVKLAKFCMRSKSKTYWLKLKQSSLAQDIMAAVLGSHNENV